MTSDAWLARHPYLQPVADLRALVETAARRVTGTVTREPDWQAYRADFDAGIPLLGSERAAIGLADPSSVVRSMLDGLLPLPVPPGLAEQCDVLRAELVRIERDSGGAEEPDVALTPANRGLFRCLLWTVLARDLRPIVAGFARWRDEERWLRNYCPTCGEAPAMGQLIGKDPGRMRMLSCGCCGTRWRYRRTGCPFCERTDDHRLAVVGVEGESGLRIDYCDGCHGYLKTYDGEGSETVLLADWTSLHLDLLARERGLKRMAASLYEVEG
jgi:FdhE protein